MNCIQLREEHLGMDFCKLISGIQEAIASYCELDRYES